MEPSSQSVSPDIFKDTEEAEAEAPTRSITPTSKSADSLVEIIPNTPPTSTISSKIKSGIIINFKTITLAQECPESPVKAASPQAPADTPVSSDTQEAPTFDTNSGTMTSFTSVKEKSENEDEEGEVTDFESGGEEEVEEEEDDADDKPLTTPAKRFKKQMQDLGKVHTPKVPRKRLLIKPTGDSCICEAMEVEQRMNGEKAFYIDDYHMEAEFMEKRRKLAVEEILLSADYHIGLDMSIRVCLLNDANLSVNDRVIIVIQQGTNEIRLPAIKFLKSGIPAISRGLIYKCEIEALEFTEDEEDADEEIEICNGAAYCYFQKDKMSRWALIRQYIGDTVAERIYMSAMTWVELKGLLQVLNLTTEHYLNLLVQGRGVNEPIENDGSPSRLRRALFDC